MHQNIDGACTSHDVEHLLIERTARNVVDDVCAKFGNASLGYGSAKSIDADQWLQAIAIMLVVPLFSLVENNRQGPAKTLHFSLGTDVQSTRSCRICTHINYRSSLV